MPAPALRSLLERLGRNRRFKRRLPSEIGRRPLWVSPDARLRFLKPGRKAFDLELLDIAKRLVQPSSIVMDIGANVGEFSVAAAHFAGPKGAVLAVEADPFLAGLLQCTVSEPDNQDLNLEIMCTAVSGGSGTERFNLAQRSRAANALSEVGSTQMGGVRRSLLVPTIAVDDLVAAWKAPDVVKIDVEGAELVVLQGARQLLGTRRPTIMFEASKSQDKIMALLASHGYELFDPSQPSLDKPIAECTFNTLAVHTSRLDSVRRGEPLVVS